MSQPRRNKPLPRRLKTLKELAAALDSPLSTVAGWVKHDTWKWQAKAPWPVEQVPEMLRWAAESLEKGRPANASRPAKPGSTQQLRDEKLRQEIRKLRANADQAETALAKERGTLHDAAACDMEAAHRASIIRNGFQNLAPQLVSIALSHGLPNQNAPQFQKKTEAIVNDCLRHLASSADSLAEAGDAASS